MPSTQFVRFQSQVVCRALWLLFLVLMLFPLLVANMVGWLLGMDLTGFYYVLFKAILMVHRLTVPCSVSLFRSLSLSAKISDVVNRVSENQKYWRQQTTNVHACMRTNTYTRICSSVHAHAFAHRDLNMIFEYPNVPLSFNVQFPSHFDIFAAFISIAQLQIAMGHKHQTSRLSINKLVELVS